MKLIDEALKEGRSNFVLIGGAGCGKSEISLNLAKVLRDKTEKTVHLFDMDMTKPLFRSRDLLDSDELKGIEFHFEEQFYDAPTLVGGVRRFLNDPDSIVVMDVGGDDIGARAIGGFMASANRSKMLVMYVLNYYRPFCRDIEHIGRFLSDILAVSGLSFKDIRFIDNPNSGLTTTEDEVIEGVQKMKEMLKDHCDIEMICTNEKLASSVEGKLPKDKIMPLHLFLTYEWLKEA
ncbi:hypothetical protein BXO88_13925 [Oribacterium sp. C9]|uniref:nucleotide-binding protein n=1 Tax=Oribacterium sp. C9 TaxID=1943579 RepID=UPI00098FAE19|nr:hypothetical protein [Oribacterium sp. C9]OON85159.1 hypothetical protein BXO88_13925 [Oribacterium sp. C9]